jgi:hypothetical protein
VIDALNYKHLAPNGAQNVSNLAELSCLTSNSRKDSAVTVTVNYVLIFVSTMTRLLDPLPLFFSELDFIKLSIETAASE